MRGDQGHWVGLEADPSKYFGFIYKIDVVETGQSYIGKRQHWGAKAGAVRCKSKIADRGSPRWKESCWKEAEWKGYKGSSKYLAKFMKDNPHLTYTYTIIKNCRSRGILVYSEAEAQWAHEVLVAKLPDGKAKFFNHQIGGIRFRPKLEVSDETKIKLSESGTGIPHNKETVSITVPEDTRKLQSEAMTGSRNPRARLTEEQVIKIVDELDTMTDEALSTEYGVSKVSISKIRKGHTWKHIDRRKKK